MKKVAVKFGQKLVLDFFGLTRYVEQLQSKPAQIGVYPLLIYG